MANRVGKIVNSYGYDFINFEHDPVTMSYKPELYYNIQHLNAYGSAMFTEYLGQIIVDKYGVGKSKLTEAQESRWEEAADYYHQFYKCCDDLLQEVDEYSPPYLTDDNGVLINNLIEIEEDMDGTAQIKKHN